MKGLTDQGMSLAVWASLVFSCILWFVIELVSNREDFILWLHKRPRAIRWAILYALMLATLLFTDFDTASAGNFLYFNF